MSKRTRRDTPFTAIVMRLTFDTDFLNAFVALEGAPLKKAFLKRNGIHGADQQNALVKMDCKAINKHIEEELEQVACDTGITYAKGETSKGDVTTIPQVKPQSWPSHKEK
jgi:hypothetical protein